MISVSGKPPVGSLANRANERNRENPRDEFSLWQNIEQLFDRRRALPRFVIASADELQRFDVRFVGNPWETLFDSRSLRRNNLELVAAIPFRQTAHDSSADVAMAIVNDGVLSHARLFRGDGCC